MVIFILMAGCAPVVVETRQEYVDKTKEYELLIRQDFEEFLNKAKEVMQ